MKTTLFIIAQYILPQHLLSRLVGKIAASEHPWVKNTFIKYFINHYDVQMHEAETENYLEFKNFNAFFTRSLKPEARPIDDGEKSITCPADGVISQLGEIRYGQIFQAKGQSYSAAKLLANDELAEQFDGGQFATIYLSPRDYHRVHMPLDGTLNSMTYVPGQLFSVNAATAENVPDLFARNERLVALFDTEIGPVAMVMVGAMIVAGIETVWDGQVAPPPKTAKTTQYSQLEPVTLKKGEEMGRFMLGSTVIMLFPKDSVDFLDDFTADTGTRMGEKFAQLK
ncbi:phosphatidylserine decarboxylase [Sinobacterium caligoides]|uniref:Phosphatidylserine decarboxylase proenzyme n=1 Tax=Sinobacterium caligoides TaxID=933926 RepID=A0A3N2DG51_9GAMM|nr:archaetidylserine decarboxylase [Sinobacterium caligoides]ROR98767.1 phosphatidylserine decarboxylase [Sinobacterium caligoides]